MKTVVVPKEDQEGIILRSGEYFCLNKDRSTVYQILQNGNDYNIFNINEVAICGKFGSIPHIVSHFDSGNNDIIKLELSGYNSHEREFWFLEV